MFFRLEYTVREMGIWPKAALVFSYGGPHQLRVELRPHSPDEEAAGHKATNAFCTASSVMSPNPEVRSIFEGIANAKLPAGTGEGQSAWEYTTKDGQKIRVPDIAEFPESFRSFFDNTQRELADIASRTISALRWRANAPGPHNPISFRGFGWSFDADFWHHMPPDIQLRVEVFEPLRASEQFRADAEAIVKAGGAEPLHHDLFREAWNHRHANPRSAIVIGMTAAEISVKRCISILIPPAEWLATNVPSPPLIQILKDYFPKLPVRCDISGRAKAPPQQLLDTLRKGVTIRNRLSHAGGTAPSDDDVDEILRAVRDLLWLTDYYSGCPWAFGYVSDFTRKQLEI